MKQSCSLKRERLQEAEDNRGTERVMILRPFSGRKKRFVNEPKMKKAIVVKVESC